MKNQINADTIFKMAVQIEENGALFYREAAAKLDDLGHKEFLNKLAAMEDVHAETFKTLEQEMVDASQEAVAFEPHSEEALYLKALADSQVFFGKKIPQPDFKDILESALQAERDSIAFYTGLKEIVPKESDQLKVQAIIKEEMRHITVLTAKLSAYLFNM